MANVFQYFSDVHTEHLGEHEFPVVTPQAPYLILAGDIGDPFSQMYKDFLTYLSSMFIHVFIISGNHEYYRTDAALAKVGAGGGTDWLNAIDDQIREITTSLTNVTFLQNTSYDIPNTDITVHGGTFWTNLHPHEELTIAMFVMDYRGMIPGFTTHLGRTMHKAALNHLDAAIAVAIQNGRRLVVVSHHLPSYALIDQKYLARPEYASLNSAYASNIPQANHKAIAAWVAGHTHTPVQKGHFYVSPIGYPGENTQDSSYMRTFTV